MKRNSQKEIENIVIKYWETEADKPTIKDVFEEWNDRKLNIGKISETTHLRNEQIFNRHYGTFGKNEIKNLNPSVLEDFLEEQIVEFDLTAKAFSNLKSITRGFLKRARKRELINFSVEEVFSEMDFSDDGRIFKVTRTETRYKSEDGRYVYAVKENPKTPAGMRKSIIPKDYCWIYKELRKLNPFGEYIMMTGDERLSAQAIRMRMRRICKRLGIYHKSPHKARKTYGSILLDNHLDNNMIIGQMGHTDILCTEKHYHRNRKTMDHKVEVINQIPEFMAK